MDKSADAASVASTPVAVATTTTTTTTHTTAVPATSSSAAANKRCLDDDGVCLNATVFEGVQYPTAHAARIARDALRAAQQYYQLFFECDCGSCNNNAERKDDDGSVHSNTVSVGTPVVGTRTSSLSSSQQQQQQQQCSVPSSSQLLATCSHHHTVHMHRVTAQQRAAYYARTPASTSAAPLSMTAAMSTTAATTTTHMSPNVLDSPYHTFFPPVLSPRHRERIIERILGHTPSPFSRWKWHKATAYANMHGRLSQAHTARQSLLLPSRQEQHHKQSQPASSRPTSPLRSSEGNDNTNLTSTHADDKDGRAATATAATAAAAAAVPATTTSNLTSTLCFPLVPHTIVQHPHTQRLTHATTAATSATTLTPSSPLPHVHTRSDAAPPHHPSLPLQQQQLTALPLHMASSSSSPTCGCSTRTTMSPRPPAQTAASVAPATTTVAMVAEAKTSAATLASTAAVTPVAAGDAVAYSFPTSQQGPEYFHAAAEDGTRRLILIMVGLPARGKTFLAQKICRLLSWHGCKATVHNLQVLWRRRLAEALASNATTGVSHGRGCVPGRGDADGDDAAPETTTMAAAQRTHDAGDTRGAAAAGCIRAAHFAQLLREPDSLARRVYRDVLHSVADDCRHFFECGGGEVVVLNDDFVTESLRRDAEAVLRPLATQLIFMEVVRAAADNAPFDECKVRDPAEYPPDVVAAEDARVDFAQRVALLERAYEPLSDAEENAAAAAVTTTTTTATTTTTTTTATQLTGAVPSRASGGATCATTGTHDTTLSATPGLDDGDADGGGVGASLRRDDDEGGCDDDGGAKNAVTATRARDDDTPCPAARGRRRRACIKVRYPDVVEVHGVSGYAASRIVSYVMNITQAKMQHPIYFVRHGQSCYNLEDRIGGDPLLTAQGMRDAAALLEFLYSLNAQLRAGTAGGATSSAAERTRVTRHAESHDGVRGGVAAERDCQQHEQHQQQQLWQRSEAATDKSHKGDDEAAATTTTTARAQAVTIPAAAAATQPTMTHLASTTPAPLSPAATQRKGAGLEIWTSQLRRAIQTAELSERLLNIRTLRWSSLNEIHAGVCEGMTYDDVMTKYPLIDQFRKHSKYTFRYPDGESYQDLVVRLEPVIMELENANKVVVVVAHQAVLRCLLAYFGSTSAESSVRVRVPHRTVWRCTYDSKGIASLDELTLDNVEVGFACGDGVVGGGGGDVRAGADDAAHGDDGAGDNGNGVRDRNRRGGGGTVTTSEEVEVDVI